MDSLEDSSPLSPLLSPRKEDEAEEDIDALLGGVEAESEEEEEGEALFDENMEKDYTPVPELDYYEPDMLDDKQYKGMTAAQRRAAEAYMRRRDAEQTKEMLKERQRRYGRLPQALLDSDDEDDNLRRQPPRAERESATPVRHEVITGSVRRYLQQPPETDYTTSASVTLSDPRGPLREWLALDAPRLEVARAFYHFLMSYQDDKGHVVYRERIKLLCSANKESLVISYAHLAAANTRLAEYLAEAPTEVLKIFDEVGMQAVLALFPDYRRICTQVHVRVSDLPEVENLRDLRQVHLNGLVKVCGVVTRRTSVFPQLTYVTFDCGKCGNAVGPFYQDHHATQEVKPDSCPVCNAHGPFTVNTEQTVYRNYQKLTLQESPGTVPAGRLPRSKDVVLLYDLIDAARPGEEIEVTGIYRHNFDVALNTRHAFPVFATIIEANYITKKNNLYSSFQITEEDEREIRRLARDERIGERIIHSIAPSIYGHEDIKTALALAMFGGVTKEVGQSHRVRGDINVLLLGDPGTAKSQFLKYVEKTVHRAVYTTGQGASAVGLTAAVRRDPVTREWTLEGGALVLADQGVCLIDEFDKMNDKDRTSIHEAMEQQSISVSKAGIVTTLKARCAVIAAANPRSGRYDPSLSFAENVELSEPILSRFDCLLVVRDTVDAIADERLAQFVVQSHINSHPDRPASTTVSTVGEADDIIPQPLLRKYLLYARQRVQPELRNIKDEDKISKLYAELRRESQTGGGMPMTVRHMESIIRMAEAHARMHLRDYVREDDVNVAIRVALESFISSQKYAIARNLRKTFRRYITFRKDYNQLLLHVLKGLVNETLHYIKTRRGIQPDKVEIECEELETRAREYDITDLQPFFTSKLFRGNDFTLEKERRMIVKSFVSKA